MSASDYINHALKRETYIWKFMIQKSLSEIIEAAPLDD
jgi:hypothetical protein